MFLQDKKVEKGAGLDIDCAVKQPPLSHPDPKAANT
jgi:hypothetical protein